MLSVRLSALKSFVNVMSLFVLGAQAAASQVQVQSGSVSQLVSVLLALAAVLGLIFLLSWLVKRSGAGWGRSDHIKVLSTMALGTRERILLVEVGATQMLLGVTAHSIKTLHVFAEPVVASGEKPGPDFAGKLAQYLQPQKNASRAQADSHRESPHEP